MVVSASYLLYSYDTQAYESVSQAFLSDFALKGVFPNASKYHVTDTVYASSRHNWCMK